jgi:hypothetical protein
LIPRVTIIRPSWLDVENAIIIFLMSFCVRAQMAVKKVVITPKHNLIERTSWLDCKWIRMKIPATTIVLEWSKADTGIGPSMAEGSHG